jgi:RNase P subunit RPR2
MAIARLRLDCVRCKAFKDYTVEQRADDGGLIVRCDECGKRQSDDRIYMINPTKEHERDENGELVDDYL